LQSGLKKFKENKTPSKAYAFWKPLKIDPIIDF
jgi:hypothetical protein